MFKVELDMSDIQWENEKYKKKFYDYVESELYSIMESCENSAVCYVENNSNDITNALETIRDNQTSYEVLDPTYTFVIATIWYQVQINS